MKKKYLLFLLISGLSFGQIAQVKDINVTGDSSPTNLFDYNGVLFFRANDGVKGVELWKSDGTNSGTTLVKDINAGTTGSSNSNPANFTAFASQVFFTATNGSDVNATELWKTDGTALGTTLVKDINATAANASGNPQNFTVINPTTMLFSASDGINGNELWKTDGSTVGTSNVIDYPGTANSVTWMENLNGTAILGQIVSTTGRELYKSDGTAVNSSIILDINPGATLGVGTAYIKSGNSIFFAGNSGTTGLELWKTDGSISGTVLVKDINTVGTTASNPTKFADLNGVVYFSAIGAAGKELWKSDGTAAGTVQVADINTGGDSSPDQITAVGGNIYFFAADDGTNFDLYMYDGTTLTKLKDFNAASSTVSTNFVELGGKIYFGADSDATNSRELWQTDGTAAGTVAVSSLITGSISPNFVSNITKVGAKLIFSASDTNGVELFSYTAPALSLGDFSKLADLKIYPNPSNGTLNTNIEDFTGVQYEVYDVLGKKVVSSKMRSTTINLELNKGVYFLKLICKDENVTEKIIIK